MKVMCLHSQQEIEAFLRRNPFLHLYSLGDLDDFFWPYTTWYALKDQQQITQLALLYTGTSLPTLLGLTEEPTDGMRELLQLLLRIENEHRPLIVGFESMLERQRVPDAL